MRKYLLAAIMAASALVPAAAFAQDHREWHGGGQRGDGGQRAQGQPRPQAQPPVQAQQPAQAQQGQGRWQARGTDGNTRPQYQGDRGWQGGGNASGIGQQPRPQGFGAGREGFQGRDGDGRNRQGRDQMRTVGQGGDQPRAGWQGGDRGDQGRPGNPGWQGNRDRPGGPGWQGNEPRRDDRADGRGGNWQGRRDDRGGAFGDNRSRADWNRGSGWNGRDNGGRDWNRGWRQDNRYNYNAYRSSNRGAYHLPRYYAPSGWGYGYRRFGVGLTLDSILYNQSYWIDDAADYRLPPAYGPYRWVRYYNDALLVDIYTGRVVDTVYDIFW
ncbi:RcnB family protein [Sphingomonas sp. BAUL-RG-20F-R05-02]|uniref:RcnB family protein n=1 Tax=Sphingomonas sp. BAUL-RG-20F-R05-02 TaxID=2914830 RepID=UPI001F597DB4|nr:RcnB family protein [Sphingomonas sp. BAUL-RG-20F-R05-02]